MWMVAVKAVLVGVNDNRCVVTHRSAMTPQAVRLASEESGGRSSLAKLGRIKPGVGAELVTARAMARLSRCPMLKIQRLMTVQADLVAPDCEAPLGEAVAICALLAGLEVALVSRAPAACFPRLADLSGGRRGRVSAGGDDCGEQTGEGECNAEPRRRDIVDALLPPEGPASSLFLVLVLFEVAHTPPRPAHQLTDRLSNWRTLLAQDPLFAAASCPAKSERLATARGGDGAASFNPPSGRDGAPRLQIRYEKDRMSALGWITVGLAVCAAAILIVYWVKQPALNLTWRLLLFCGIALLPTAAAGTSTTEALEKTTQREFCGSCHVMDAHYRDAINPESASLAARHTRNDLFGENSCYKCHANYGMFGYPLTKLNGLKHVWHYYFGEYGSMTLEEALPKLHTYEPYPNENCLHCHTGKGSVWSAVPDHRAINRTDDGTELSCASLGCHGAPHPDSLRAREKAASEQQAKPSPAGGSL